ncbi:MAG TPA: hypothetical protein VG013_24625 [Gemmataceae bacterium]|nr:hypothetical protein [Gemmataceae bacterium]
MTHTRVFLRGRAPLSDLATAELLLGLDRLEQELQNCGDLPAEVFGAPEAEE